MDEFSVVVIKVHTDRGTMLRTSITIDERMFFHEFHLPDDPEPRDERLFALCQLLRALRTPMEEAFAAVSGISPKKWHAEERLANGFIDGLN